MGSIYTMDRQIFQFLTDDGTEDGEPNMAVDGSSVNVEYYIQPPAGEEWHITRLIFHLEDDTGRDLFPEKFGDLAALTNGCIFQGKRGGVVTVDFSKGLPIKSHSHLGRFSYDVSYSAGAQGGAGAPANGVVQDRFTYTKSGQPIVLRGDYDESISFTIRDDLQTLVELTAQAQGQKVVV